jgi:hypothetical protein
MPIRGVPIGDFTHLPAGFIGCHAAGCRLVYVQRFELEGQSGDGHTRIYFSEGAKVRIVPGLTTLITIIAITSSTHAHAAASDRYCLQGRSWGFPGNCQFATRHQCLAAASGTNAHCGINPRYAGSRRQ